MGITSKFQFDNNFFIEPIHTTNFVIYQIGDLYCDYNTNIAEHKHGIDFEISFIDSGEARFYANNIMSTCHTGQIFMSLAGDTHKIEPSLASPARFFYIAFSMAPNAPAIELANQLKQKFCSSHNRTIELPYVFQQMINILSEVTYKKDYSPFLIEAYLMQILVSIYRSATKQLYTMNTYTIHFQNNLAYNVCNYIDENLCSINKLSDLSLRFSYEYSYISKSFKKVIGKSIKDYFLEKKFEKAKLLMSQEHKSITYTAKALGYSTIHNFSRAFKTQFNISPQEYKAAYAPNLDKNTLK